MLEVRLTAVRVDMQSNTPVVLLQEIAGERSLPIFIGAPEATAIAYAVQKVEVPRPMTHDLMRDVVGALGATVSKVVVTEVHDGTYYALIHFERDGVPIIVSARPSDAIALAARTEAPIFVADELMDSEGVVLEDAEDEEEEPSDGLVDEFLEFLDNVRPEDFSP
jgi:bifunctional DNase/RNase